MGYVPTNGHHHRIGTICASFGVGVETHTHTYTQMASFCNYVSPDKLLDGSHRMHVVGRANCVHFARVGVVLPLVAAVVGTAVLRVGIPPQHNALLLLLPCHMGA